MPCVASAIVNLPLTGSPAGCGASAMGTARVGAGAGAGACGCAAGRGDGSGSEGRDWQAMTEHAISAGASRVGATPWLERKNLWIIGVLPSLVVRRAPSRLDSKLL